MQTLDLGHTRLIIETCKAEGLLRNQAAYVLATAYHETAHSMEPIKETVMLHHKDKNPSDREVMKRLDRAWAKGQLPWVKSAYWRDGWFGRGFVQLTHQANYKMASSKLGVDMVHRPALALDPEIAAKVLVRGSKEGWFTTRDLSDYITLQSSDFVGARAIINGRDKANEIAAIAESYNSALKHDGYGEEAPVAPPAVEVPKQSGAWAALARLFGMLAR